jgi:hypothetical protein
VIENIVLAAYADDIPAGFMFVHYFGDIKFGIISYLGVDYSAFRASEFEKVVEALVKRARRELLESRKCRCLFL